MILKRDLTHAQSSVMACLVPRFWFWSVKTVRRESYERRGTTPNVPRSINLITQCKAHRALPSSDAWGQDVLQPETGSQMHKCSQGAVPRKTRYFMTPDKAPWLFECFSKLPLFLVPLLFWITCSVIYRMQGWSTVNSYRVRKLPGLLRNGLQDR